MILEDNVSVLVVDGVRESNRQCAAAINTPGFNKGDVKVIWVTSQQVEESGMDLFENYSWTEAEAASFVALLSGASEGGSM